MLKRLMPFFVLSLCCHAEDFTLADGTVLKDAEVLRQEGESLQIRHAGGIEKFDYTELGPELQEKYELTPQQVESRREAARSAAEEKRQAALQAKAARETAMQEAQTRREAALEASGKYARYLRGADVIQLCSAYLTMQATAAEYLAAEWNRREALRLALPADAERFAAEAESLKADLEKDRAVLAATHAELESLRTAVQAKDAELKRKNEELATLRAQVAQLNKELGRAESAATPRSTTVVVDRPVYVPTYVPAPAPPPRARVCPAPKPRPAVRRPATPRPVKVSPGARPANSAHTLPRK